MEQIEKLTAYVPLDRRDGTTYPDTTSNGAAIFADVSGFTPLTERLLIIYGKREAPAKLTDYLNRIYTVLITEVHRYGGIVIGFAGDAVTCWFDGDDGCRATACAVAMQQGMLPFGEIIMVDGARISITIKIGVAQGSARRFVVGERYYLDVLGGQTITRMAYAQGLAEKGEVILSPEVAQRVNGAAKFSEWREEKFAVIEKLVRPIPSAQLSPSPNQAKLKQWVIPPIYNRIQTSAVFLLDEIRPAAALFCSFDGIDYDNDPRAAAKMHSFMVSVQNLLADNYDSYICQLVVGDKGNYIYTLFGAPTSHSDDPLRAVKAAKDIQDVAINFTYITNVKIGVTYGRFFTGEFGADYRLTYGAQGDVVNTSARLMQQADPSQTLVSREIYLAARELFAFEFEGTFKLKGKRDRFPIWSLVGLKRRERTSFIDYRDPLFSRNQQATHLDQLFAHMLDDRAGQTICIEGDKGIGKSHLAATFLERAGRHNIRLVMGICQENTRYTPYDLWRQIFIQLLDLPHRPTPYILKDKVEAMNPDWLIRLPLLGDLLNWAIPDNPTTRHLDPQTRQDSLFDLCGRILYLLLEQSRQPIVILLEDTHWVDEASWALTQSMARLNREKPILILMTQRPGNDMTEFKFQPNYQKLELSALGGDGVRELCEYHLQGEITPLALSLINHHAQGVPFFVRELTIGLRETEKIYHHASTNQWRISEEMLNTLRRANCLVRQDGVWILADNAPLNTVDLGIPDQVHTIVLARLGGLPILAQNTLKVASVIGRIFEFDILLASHPDHQSSSQLREDAQHLQEADLIQREPNIEWQTYLFQHNITQQIVYETLIFSQEQKLHQAIGDAIEQQFPNAVERMAHHYYFAKNFDKAKVYMEQSAEKARVDYANESAIHYYDLLIELEDRWAWRVAKVEIYHLMGDREEEQTALDQLPDDTPRYQYYLLWSDYYYALSDYDTAEEKLEHALQQATNDIDRGACWNRYGQIAYQQGNYTGAEEHFNKVLSLRITDQQRVDTLRGLGNVSRQTGDFETSLTHLNAALFIAQQLEDKQKEGEIVRMLSTVYYYRRDRASLKIYQDALELNRRVGDRLNEGKTLTELAQMLRDLGRYNDASEHLKDALSLLQATGNRWGEVNVWMSLGVMYQEMGVFNVAESVLNRGKRLAAEIGDEAGVAYVLTNLSLVEKDRDNYTKSLAHLSEAAPVAQKENDDYLLAGIYTYQAANYIELAQYDQAICLAELSLEMCERLEMKWAKADNLALLGQAYRLQHDLQRALSYIEPAWALLTECQGEGPEFPQVDSFICYQLFQTVGDARASDALVLAQKIVRQRAENIAETQYRERFLAMHNEILQAGAENE